jgi:hypothetical protein
MVVDVSLGIFATTFHSYRFKSSQIRMIKSRKIRLPVPLAPSTYDINLLLKAVPVVALRHTSPLCELSLSQNDLNFRK